MTPGFVFKTRPSTGLKLLMVLLFLPLGLTAAETEVSQKLQRSVVLFQNIYKINTALPAPAPTAVLYFGCEPKLAEKGVGKAVAELISNHLLKSGKFKIVEREQLQRVMREQALSLTGAVEDQNAVKVGQLTGARLLVMGSIALMGKRYQISIMLVDAQTGEVVLSDVIDADRREFDQEAAPYLVLVPEKQAIGLYLTAGFSPATASMELPPLTVNGTYMGGAYMAEIVPKTVAAGETPSLGLGVRYHPFKHLRVDAAYCFRSVTANSVMATVNTGNEFALKISGSAVSADLCWVQDISEKLRCFGGAGLSVLMMKFTGSPASFHWVSGMPGSTFDLTAELLAPGQSAADNSASETSFDQTVMSPYGVLGAEYRPQSRIGIGLFTRFSPGMARDEGFSVRLSGVSNYDGQPISFAQDTVTVYRYYTPSFSAGTYLSLYF